MRLARFEELARWPGMGPAKATSVVAALSLGHRAERSEDRVVIRSADDVARVANEYLAGLRRERVIVLVCDSRNAVYKVVVVADGSLDRSMFPIREILNAVLRNDGRAFAIAHNHPGGDAAPSADDASVTKLLQEASSKVGLRMLGHVIVTDCAWALVKP